MKLMWFHLMPYTELPDDFRDANPSVWVDIHSSLFDPKPRASHVQRLHGRARIRRALRFRRRLRERAPLQRLRPDAVAQLGRVVAGAPHHRYGDLRHGQLAGAVQSADARGRRIRDDRRDLRRPADRRVPGRHADGHLLRLWHRTPASFASATTRRTTWWCAPGPKPDTFAFNGRFNQQRYVNIWPRPVQKSASADLDSRRRLGRDVAVVRRDGLRLLLPVLLRLQGRPRDDGWLLGRNVAAGQGTQSLPGRLPAIRRRRRKPPARLRSLLPRPPNTSTAVACTSMRAGRRRPAIPARAASAPASRAQIKQAADANVRGKSTGERFASVAREMDAIVDKGYVIIGSAR